MELTLDEALQKAVEAHKAGQIQEADRLYTAILQAQPKHPDANHNMGVLAAGVGKVQEALPFFKTALEANPSIGQYWLSYIDALIKLDRMADAKAVFDQAKDKGAKGEAFDQLEQRLNSPNKASIDPPQDQLQQLINLYQQGQLQQTLDNAKQLLSQFPNSFILYNLCGAANGGLGQLESSIDSYKQALKIKPYYAYAYNNMGNALKDKGDIEAAIENYKQAVKIKPDYAEAYYNMGNALKDKGDTEAAIESFKKALKIKPDYAEASYNMGNALSDKGDLEAAIESYKEALKIKPDYAEAYSNMGVALRDKGDLEAAIESYKQALKIKPDYADAYNNMGVTLKDKGDLEAALESYKQALKTKPDYAETYNNIGSILLDMGEIEAAVDSFYNRISLKPDFETEIKLSEVLLRYKKDASRALPLLKSALIKKPMDARANAYKSIALRGLNKFREAEHLINFSNLVRTENIQRYTNLDIVAFNKQLLSKLLEHPRRVLETDTLNWAIRGGTAIRNLFVNPESVIKTFEGFLRQAIDERIQNLPDDPEHPFLMKKPKSYRLNCWANLLEAGGYQSNHIHNNGWMSGVYYVSIPSLKAEVAENAGWITFNRAGYDLPHFGGEYGIKTIKPVPGMLILFPSYVWHGTIPFSGTESRVSISFDVQFN